MEESIIYGDGAITQLVKHLPCKQEELSSTANTYVKNVQGDVLVIPELRGE